MKKNLNICTILLFTLLFMAGCKKDKEEAPAFKIEGTWRVASTSLNSVSYYNFGDDNFLYILQRDANGLRTLTRGVYKFTNNQLLLTFPPDIQSIGSSLSNVLYNVTQGNDTLYMDGSSYNNITTVLLKDNLAPKTVADFITKIEPVLSFTDTAEAKYLAFNGGKLYGTNGTDPTLYVYSTTDKKIAEARSTTEFYEGIEFDFAGNFWATQYGNHIYKVDVNTGNILFTSSNAPSYIVALAYDGLFMVGASTNGDDLHQYYINNDDFESAYGTSLPCDDLAFADGHGFVVKSGTIHRYTSSFDHYEKSYYLTNYKCVGIAYDAGTSKFWVSAINYTTGKGEILQLQLN